MKTRALSLLLTSALWAAAAPLPQARAAEPFRIQPHASTQPMSLSVGQSSLLTFPEAVDRVSISNDSVAEVVVVSPSQLLVHGKQPGAASLIVWRAAGSHLFQIQVQSIPYERGRFEEFIRKIAPEERELWAFESPGTIILAGKVRNPANLSRVADTAKAFAGNVINVVDSPAYNRGPFDELLRNLMPEEDGLKAYQSDKAIILAGKAKHPASVNKALAAAAAVAEHVVDATDLEDPKQVLIEVRIAEVERKLAHALGIDYFAQGASVSSGSFVGGALPPQTPTTPKFGRLVDPTDILLSPAVKQLLELRGDSFDLSIALNALEQEGLVHILAEPNLLAMSGKEASFLAGGEFPIPVAQGNNAISIEFKEFGIRLKFKPEVTSGDTIRMAVEPEVSVLDSGAASVTVAGFKVPGLITRRASTTVEMRSGESLVIGGLLSKTTTRSEDQVPLLGSIPILGKLFSSEKFLNDETELLVLVTPRLVRPARVNVPERFSDPGSIGEALRTQVTSDSEEEWSSTLRRAITPAGDAGRTEEVE